MGRWEPGTLDRLRQASMELFADPGFDRTSVAEIAERAGVTERTFFRYFADKREVLFAGATELQERMLDALRAADPDASPLDAAAAAVYAAGESLQGHGEFSRVRWQLITAYAELQERELKKMATLAEAITGALVERGADRRAAVLAAEAAVAVYRTAYEEWMRTEQAEPLVDVMRASFALLRSVAST